MEEGSPVPLSMSMCLLIWVDYLNAFCPGRPADTDRFKNLRTSNGAPILSKSWIRLCYTRLIPLRKLSRYRSLGKATRFNRKYSLGKNRGIKKTQGVLLTDNPQNDALRKVVIDLYMAEGPSAKLKKASIIEAAKLQLKRDITNVEFQKFMKELSSRKFSMGGFEKW